MLAKLKLTKTIHYIRIERFVCLMIILLQVCEVWISCKTFVTNYQHLYLFSIKLICSIHKLITCVSQVGHICWNGLCMHDEWFNGQLMSSHGISITIILERFWHQFYFFNWPIFEIWFLAWAKILIKLGVSRISIVRFESQTLKYKDL